MLNRKMLKVENFIQSRQIPEFGFMKTSLGKTKEKKQLSNKDQTGFKGCSITINKRFIALLMRCGKRSVSYNLFLNTLSQCKDLFNYSLRTSEEVMVRALPRLPAQALSTSGWRAADKEKKNNQNLFNNPFFNKRITDSAGGRRPVQEVSISGQPIIVRNNRVKTASAGDVPSTHILSVNTYRGLWSRFRLNLLLISSNNVGCAGDRPPATFFTNTMENKSICKKRGTDAKKDGIKEWSKIPLLAKKININTRKDGQLLEFERKTTAIHSVNKVSPSVETRKVRIGGATYAVPYVPHNKRQRGVGIRWLIACATSKKKESKHTSAMCLARELVDSLKDEGASLQKRDQNHQLAAANRAYTRYRWW